MTGVVKCHNTAERKINTEHAYEVIRVHESEIFQEMSTAANC